MSTPNIDTFRPLQIISEERSIHGLRYGDYTRYRKHCAHKTHRLRSSLKMTHGKGRDFKKLPKIRPESAKHGHLQLLLFETERAWAYAQELSAPHESRRSTARYRRSHDYLSRLLGLAHSSELPAPLSSHAMVELIIYALIHTARFNLRRSSASTATYYGLENDARTGESASEDYAPAYPLVQLSVAHALLDELEKTARTSKEVAIARAFKDEIGPEIRWCVHEFNRGNNSEDEGDVELEKHVLAWKKREWDVEGIAGVISPAYAERVVKDFGTLVNGLHEEAAFGGNPASKKQILEDLVWDGGPVPVRNPELVDVLLKVQETTRKLTVDASNEEPGIKITETKGKSARGKIAKYDGVLQSLSDAVDQARKLLEAQQLSGSSNAVPGVGNRDIQFMHGYLTYQHLTFRIERDLLLLSALSDETPWTGKQPVPQNTASILHLLSGVLQSLSQTLTLPIADESADLSTALSMRLSHAKATRALHLARAYASHRKYAEALSLTQRGYLHIREARSTLLVLPPDSSSLPQLKFYPLDAETLNELEGQFTRDEERYKKEWFGYNGGIVGLSEEPERNSKHKKPLFFDIAFNYVEPPMEKLRVRAGMPPREDEAGESVKAKAEKEEEHEEREEVETPAPRRGGLSSLLGSWWGR